MLVSQPSKKRSAGRPKENKLIRELKVKTWFNAVAEASGKTAYELEREFAPSYVDRNNFDKQRARLWEKYRLGQTMPTMKVIEGGRRPVALLVEEKYPGTLNILTNPVWILADPNISVGVDDIKDLYESFSEPLRQILLDDESKIFWRRHTRDIQSDINKISSFNSMEAFIALLGCMREGLIFQKQELFLSATFILKNLKKFEYFGNVPIAETLAKNIVKSFCRKYGFKSLSNNN